MLSYLFVGPIVTSQQGGHVADHFSSQTDILIGQVVVCESDWGDPCHCGLARQCCALNVVLKLMQTTSAYPADLAAKRSTSHLMPLPSRAARSQRNAEIVSSQKSGCSWTTERLISILLGPR